MLMSWEKKVEVSVKYVYKINKKFLSYALGATPGLRPSFDNKK